MPKQETLHLRPTEWENDPEEERIKLSTIDPTPNCSYTHYVVFFRLDDNAKQQAADVLKLGLERTLSQARYLCGKIEKDPEGEGEGGGLSFVKRRDTTVRLVLKHLDAPEDADKYPSLDDIERAHFACQALGPDLALWSIPEMLWGEGNPAADVDNNSPTTTAYQLNFARGGLVFSMHSHHYASDMMGWSNFTRQLADNCYAVAHNKEFPPWDPACIDASRFTKHVPKEGLVDGPPAPQRHPGHPTAQQACLFHLPASKAARLKQLATPREPSDRPGEWISTYDATCAYLWRQLTKVRAPLHLGSVADPATSHGFFGEAVNMRPRLQHPPVPARMMRNVLCGAFGDRAPVTPRPTYADIISDQVPLAELALYVRRLTNSCSEAHMGTLVEAIAPIRDKRALSLCLEALPPMSVWVTDHRMADVGGLDFGFGTPITYRHLWGADVSPGLVLIYAPIRSSPNPDEGCTLTITLETELVPKLLADPEWNEYFEYRDTD